MKKIFTQFWFCLGFVLAAAPGLAGGVAPESYFVLDHPGHVQSRDGFFDVRLTGLFDVEGYYADRHPGGLIFGGEGAFINPRLSLFLDTKIGAHFYSLVQARIDQGFDPRVRRQDARFDEYLIRYIPFGDGRLNLQFGKFATVVGNWVPRHDSWQNPFITAPLPYENVVAVGDRAPAKSAAAFIARGGMVDKKGAWVPLIWGPAYTSGGSVFGSIERFDYALEFKNDSVSSRPSVWDAQSIGWSHPTVSGRFGYRPDASWNVGVSGSEGTYLVPGAERALPAGKSRGDYRQFTVGPDVSYAHGHWQWWAEVFLARFEIPSVGHADLLAYYVEAKYKFTAQLFGALRWNQELFGSVNDGTGGRVAWDKDIWRIDAALGYRFSRHWQAKLQYSYTHQRRFQEGEQLVAGQVTLKF